MSDERRHVKVVSSDAIREGMFFLQFTDGTSVTGVLQGGMRGALVDNPSKKMDMLILHSTDVESLNKFALERGVPITEGRPPDSTLN